MKTINKVNNIISLTIFVIVLCSITGFFIFSHDRNINRPKGEFIEYAHDSTSIWPTSIRYIKQMREYSEIILTGDSSFSRHQLTIVRNKVLLLKNNSDTINGVVVKIDNQVSYNDYFKTLNLFTNDTALASFPYNNLVYFMFLTSRQRNLFDNRTLQILDSIKTAKAKEPPQMTL